MKQLHVLLVPLVSLQKNLATVSQDLQSLTMS